MPLFDLKADGPINFYLKYLELASLIGVTRKGRMYSHSEHRSRMGFYKEGISNLAESNNTILEAMVLVPAFNTYQITGEYIHTLDTFKAIDYLKKLKKTGNEVTFHVNLGDWGFSQTIEGGATIAHRRYWESDASLEFGDFPSISSDGIIIAPEQLTMFRNVLKASSGKMEDVPVLLSMDSTEIILGKDAKKVSILGEAVFPIETSVLWRNEINPKKSIPHVSSVSGNQISFIMPQMTAALIPDILDKLAGSTKGKLIRDIGQVLFALAQKGKQDYLYFACIDVNSSIHAWMPIQWKVEEEYEEA